MSNKPPVNLSAMNRAFFEGLNSGARLELLCRLHAMTVELAERLAKNSTNSSKPPSSDSPFGGLPSKGEGGQKDDVKGSAASHGRRHRLLRAGQASNPAPRERGADGRAHREPLPELVRHLWSDARTLA